MYMQLDNLFWLVSGLFTVYLMYGKKEEIPILKALLVTLFGTLSLVVWVLFNISKKIPNPLIKRVQHQVVPPPQTTVKAKPIVKTRRTKRI